MTKQSFLETSNKLNTKAHKNESRNFFKLAARMAHPNLLLEKSAPEDANLEIAKKPSDFSRPPKNLASSL